MHIYQIFKIVTNKMFALIITRASEIIFVQTVNFLKLLLIFIINNHADFLKYTIFLLQILT